MPTCLHINWKLAAAYLVADALTSIAVVVLWASGFGVKWFLTFEKGCEDECLSQLEADLQPLIVTASIVYGLTALASIVATVGVLSGILRLEIPYAVVTIVRMLTTIVISELLVVVHYDYDLYALNRFIMYTSTFINIVFYVSFLDFLKAESRRVQEILRGNPVHCRPLDILFVQCYGSDGLRISSSRDVVDSPISEEDPRAANRLQTNDGFPRPPPNTPARSPGNKSSKSGRAESSRSDDVINDDEFREAISDSPRETSRSSKSDHDSSRRSGHDQRDDERRELLNRSGKSDSLSSEEQDRSQRR